MRLVAKVSLAGCIQALPLLTAAVLGHDAAFEGLLIAALALFHVLFVELGDLLNAIFEVSGLDPQVTRLVLTKEAMIIRLVEYHLLLLDATAILCALALPIKKGDLLLIHTHGFVECRIVDVDFFGAES